MRRTIMIALFLCAAACQGQGRAPDILPRFTGIPSTRATDVTAVLKGAGLLAWRPGVETRIATAVLGALRARGYLLAGMPTVLMLFAPDSSMCEADIRVEAGPAVVFGGVAFTGAVSIPEETLARDMAIAPGLLSPKRCCSREWIGCSPRMTRRRILSRPRQ
ncbi:MAG: hypothetical protein IPP94_13895 [Ignavibacteria bacterium]|nr:hypothetical protein [Ignavibacteria bacterium]